MKRLWLPLVMMLCLVVGPTADTALAKSYGGGGGSKASSSGSSSSGSRSSGSSSSGRSSYSSGSSSPSKSTSSSSSGKSSYSSSPSKSTPSAPSTPSRSYQPSASPSPAYKAPTYDSSAGNSAKKEPVKPYVWSSPRYDSSPNPTIGNPRPTPPSPRPAPIPASPPSYVTHSGQTRVIIHDDPVVVRFRNSGYTYDHYVSRPVRMQTFYGQSWGLYSSRPVVVYNDPIDSIFWWWMLDQSLDTRASWAYNHRSEIDDARWRDMVTKDAQLEARVRQLEQANGKPDPTYVPTGVEPDMMYDGNYVKAVTGVSGPPVAQQESSITFWGFCKFMFWLVLIGVGIYVLIAFIRFKTQG